MRKFRIGLAAMFAAAALPGGTYSAQEEPADMALLVYMCGTDLQDAACQDMYEMAEAAQGGRVKIAVLAGGAAKWDDEDLSADTRNLITIADGGFSSVEDLGWKSMGAEDSLLEFLDYGFSRFPAKRTMVVLWDHGAGAEGGICFDETAEDDSLTLTEIDRVLARLDEKYPDRPINIFGCDACMMADYEMAAMLSEHRVEHFLASQELEPGTGWNYTPWLRALFAGEQLTNEELCARIISSFKEQALLEEPEDYVTLSAVDLGRMPALMKTMERFASGLVRAIEDTDFALVRRGRSRMYTFGSFDDGSWDMVDMKAVLDAYAQLDPAAAKQAARQLEAAVLQKMQTDNLPECCGLSMLIPHDTSAGIEEFKEGIDLTGCIPNWVRFINRYSALLNEGSYSFGTLVPFRVQPGGMLSGRAGSFAQAEGGTAGEKETAQEEWTDEEREIVGEGDFAFSLRLTGEDMEYLDYVEGMVLLDASDDGMIRRVDLGITQRNLVDWEAHRVSSLPGSGWPVLDGQMIPVYDQAVTSLGRRCLVPVRLNGEATYLLVFFPDHARTGRIIGANAGYDQSGHPVRRTVRLRPGDVIVPLYTMYYKDAKDEEAEYAQKEFEGNPIEWTQELTIGYEPFGDRALQFCFILNDIYGDYQMSEVVPLAP